MSQSADFTPAQGGLLEALARAKGHAVSSVPETSLPFAKIERARAEEAAWKNARSGDVMPDGSVCLGTYRSPRALAPLFNVFAAPEDLPGSHTYSGALETLAALKDWHGFDGETYASERALFDALDAGTYGGGWILPGASVLAAFNREGVIPESLLARSTSSHPFYWTSELAESPHIWIYKLSRENPETRLLVPKEKAPDTLCRLLPVRLTPKP